MVHMAGSKPASALLFDHCLSTVVPYSEFPSTHIIEDVCKGDDTHSKRLSNVSGQRYNKICSLFIKINLSSGKNWISNRQSFLRSFHQKMRSQSSCCPTTLLKKLPWHCLGYSAWQIAYDISDWTKANPITYKVQINTSRNETFGINIQTLCTKCRIGQGEGEGMVSSNTSQWGS